MQQLKKQLRTSKQSQQSPQQQRQQLLLDSSQESPSTSRQQITSSSQFDRDKRSDLGTPQNNGQIKSKQQPDGHQLGQLDSSGTYNKPEDQSLLTSSGYRSQTCSVDFSRSATKRAASSTSESRRLMERSLCGCCCRSNSIHPSDSPMIMSRATRLVLSYFLAEMLGTFILVLIGDGSIAAYVVMKNPVDVFNACFAFGVGAMIATFLAAKISGAHLNPAATVALALDGKLKWRLVPVYILAQYLGGFLAALVLYVNYIEAISALDGGSRSAFGKANSTGGIFATYPSEWVSVWGSLLDQIVGTAVLIFTLNAVTDKNNGAPSERHQPLLVAFVIGLVCFAFSPNCGAIFNPARDLAPRILTWLVGYPSDVWSPIGGYYWLTASLIGPHIGAILGYFAYKILIGGSLANKRQYEIDQQDSQCHPAHSIDGKQTPAVKLVQISHHNHDNQCQQSAPDTNYGSAKH